MKRALIIVDIQNDFLPGGTLAVPGSHMIIETVNLLMHLFDYLVFTRDWHPQNHCSFKEWPAHCIQGTKGAEISREINVSPNIPGVIVNKGSDLNEECYSGFDQYLERKFKSDSINDVYVCGLATEYCVKETALDFKKAGFNTYVIVDAVKGLDPIKVVEAYNEMRSIGINLIYADRVGIMGGH